MATSVPLQLSKVQSARTNFIAGEPRNLFYLVAIELIDLSRRRATKVTMAQSLAVLLQTWNVSYYRFRGKFSAEDLTKIEALLKDHLVELEKCRERSIATLESSELKSLRALFGHFEAVLGPVGAAKTLHLLAREFFPLWDRAIAKAYRVKCNADGYIAFMNIAKKQCEELKNQGAPWPDLLKAVDEYNYCTFTMKIADSNA
jgi:hypothetical protein